MDKVTSVFRIYKLNPVNEVMTIWYACGNKTYENYNQAYLAYLGKKREKKGTYKIVKETTEILLNDQDDE